MSACGICVFFATVSTVVIWRLQRKKRRHNAFHSRSKNVIPALESHPVSCTPNQYMLAHQRRRALVDSELHSLIDQGVFQFHVTVPVPKAVDLHSYVQPASIDLPVTGSAFLVKEKVLPFHHRVIDLLEDLTLERKPLAGDGVVLLRGQTYLVYCGTVNLPKNMKGCLSPKSSIGRVDLLVRGVVDGSGLYDTISGGARRSLWLEITPRSFNVRIKEGLALTQLMVFRNCSVLEKQKERERLNSNQEDVESVAGGQTLIYSENGEPLPHIWENDALVLCLSVPHKEQSTTTSYVEKRAPCEAIIGYEAISTNEVIDLSRTRCHEWHKFFRRIDIRDRTSPGLQSEILSPEKTSSVSSSCETHYVTKDSSHSSLQTKKLFNNHRLTLEKDRFYILATKERISVPTNLSAEMVPFSHHVGELRAHYAGFFDPGFGYGKAGETHGTVGVLEVRPHETINIYDGQPICLMEFFRNSKIPTKPYGFSGNNYFNQRGPQLAKFFTMTS